MPKSSIREKTAYSAAAHLIFYGLAVALPLVLALGALLLHSMANERERLDGRILQVLNDLTDNLDRDVDRHLTILQTLATSPLLKNDDWPAFYQQAKAAMQGRAYIVVTDSSGRQVVNTFVAYGKEPEFTGDPETLQRMLAHPRPVVSNLFVSLVVKAPVFNISIPVMSEGKVRLVLSLGLLPEDLNKILSGLSLDPEWVTTISDANGIVLARSRDPDRFIGTTVPDRLRPFTHTVFKTVGLDNEYVLRAVTTSTRSGWGLAVNYPVRLANQQFHRPLLLWGGISLLATGFAIWLGILVGRKLTAPLAIVSAAAAALGRGEHFAMARSRLKEANGFGQVLIKAQHEIETRKAELEKLAGELKLFLDTCATGLKRCNRNLRYVSVNEAYARMVGFPQSEIVGRPMEEIIGKQALELEQPHIERVLAGETVEYEETIRFKNSAPVRLHVVYSPERTESGDVIGWVASVTDVTARKRAEEHKDLLIEELNHRVKNTLAVVQAISLQSFKSAASKEDATEAFQKRLGALASAHDLLTREHWESACLQEIVETAIASLGDAARFHISGPIVRLPPKQAVAFTMGIHELCTNALKYGALSVPEGRINVKWSIDNGTAPRRLRFRWEERGGPEVQEPTRKGFGSLLVERLLAQDLDAKIVVSYACEGVICSIDAPLTNSPTANFLNTGRN